MVKTLATQAGGSEFRSPRAMPGGHSGLPAILEGGNTREPHSKLPQETSCVSELWFDGETLPQSLR